MQRNQQTKLGFSKLYIHKYLFLYCNIQFSSHKAFHDIIYYIQVSLDLIFFLKSAFQIYSLCLQSNIKLSCPKGKEGRKEAALHA